MITFQQLVIYTESNHDSFAPFTLHGRLQHPELSQAPIIVMWLLHFVDTAEACVSCATVLGYSRLLPARCSNMPHVTRNPWQQFRLSLRTEWLPRICGHPYHPTWPLLISFYGTMLRNVCSVTNRTHNWRIEREHYKWNQANRQHDTAMPHPDVPRGGWWSLQAHDVMWISSTCNKVCVLSVLSHSVHMLVIYS